MAYYMTDWSDDYLIGIDKIDNQHKEFFRSALSKYQDFAFKIFYQSRFLQLIWILNLTPKDMTHGQQD
jgi:hypothetical protein